MSNPFSHARRGSMPPQRVARIHAAAHGCCHVCGRKLGPSDDYEIDHVIALENGGSDDDENLRPCCSWCHGMKTGDDHEQAGHARRTYTKHNVPARFRKSRSWRS